MKPLDFEKIKILVQNGYKMADIAKLYECSNAYLSIKCKKEGIKFDKYKHLSKTGHWDNKEWLYDQHWNKEKSIGTISKEIGISSPRLLKRFKKYGIKTRSNGDATRLNKNIISQNIKNAWLSEEIRNKWLIARNKVWQNPEYVAIHSKALSDRWFENRELMLSYLKSTKTPECRKKVIDSIKNNNHSCIENTFQYFLDINKIKYEKSVIVYEREFDFKIGDILVEVDGSYFHKLGHVKANDKYKDIICQLNNVKLIRIKEEDFYAKDTFKLLCDKINYIPQVSNFNIKDVVIEKATTDEAKSFFKLFHYLHNCGRYGKIYKFSINNEIIAMAILGSPIRKESATSIGLDIKNTYEIVRYAKNPLFMNKNFGSWAISQIIKRNRGFNIIAYADPNVGHTGTIYKAANFQKIGNEYVDYWYESESGEIVHKKTIYNRAVALGLRESEYVTKYNYKKHIGSGKIKFLYLA